MMTKVKVLIILLGGGAFAGAGMFWFGRTTTQLSLPLPPACTPQAVIIALEKQPLPAYYRHTADYPVVLDFKKMSQAVVP